MAAILDFPKRGWQYLIYTDESFYSILDTLMKQNVDETAHMWFTMGFCQRL